VGEEEEEEDEEVLEDEDAAGAVEAVSRAGGSVGKLSR